MGVKSFSPIISLWGTSQGKKTLPTPYLVSPLVSPNCRKLCSKACEVCYRIFNSSSLVYVRGTPTSGIDEELSNVIKCIKNEGWQKLANKRYLMIRSELSVNRKLLVLRGAKISIRSSLWEEVLELAHEGHPWIMAMTCRLCTKVWYPNCDARMLRDSAK